MVRHSETGELQFDTYDESANYFAGLLSKASPVTSANAVNAGTYKKQIVELRNVNYSVDGRFPLSNNRHHKQHAFWGISEALSEVLNLTRPIMERYSPEIMDNSYDMQHDRQPVYAYGERWHVDGQVMNVFNLLKQKPTSKRAHMAIYNGSDTAPEKSDVPCTLGHTLSIRDNKLDITAHFRSQDFFAGNLYDTVLNSVLQRSFVSWLRNAGQPDLEIGDMHFNIGSLHYYPEHSQGKLEKMMANTKPTEFYNGFEVAPFDSSIAKYFADMHKLLDAEISSFHGNFESADKQLQSIDDQCIKDYALMFLIKNGKTHGQDVTKYGDMIVHPENRKWIKK
jgi:thymidylate synthase